MSDKAARFRLSALLGLHALGCLMVSAARAEPTPTVQWLMDRQPNWLDFGMVKMELHLRQWFGHHDWDFGPAVGLLKLSPSVHYDWEQNRIVITVSVAVPAKSITKANATDACKRIVQYVRIAEGVKDDGTLEISGAFRWHFLPSGYVFRDLPKELDTELQNVAQVTAYIWWASKPSSQGGLDKTLECNAKLVGQEIQVVQ